MSDEERTMQETIQEYIDSRGVTMRIDRQAGVIRGVKILGTESRNGRSYLPEALRAARELYEAAKVNVNHPKGSPSGPRDYQDRIGVMRSVVLRAGEGLFGDLHFNPKHALAEQLMWDAQHAPENVGFSHNVLARTAQRGERVVVEAITKVHSVDLVADPATTRGLFEAAEAKVGHDARKQLLADLDAEQLREQRPDLVEELTSELASQVVRLTEQVESLRAEQAMAARRLRVRELLAEYRLPDPEHGGEHARAIVSSALLEALHGAADEAAMRALLDERQRLLEASAQWRGVASKPLCRDQHLAEGLVWQCESAEEFARAIC